MNGRPCGLCGKVRRVFPQPVRRKLEELERKRAAAKERRKQESGK